MQRLIDPNVGINNAASKTPRTTVLPVFLCPSDDRIGVFTATGTTTDVAHANYVGVFGTNELAADPSGGNGTFFRNSRVRFADIADGTSNTFIVGERSSDIALATWAGAVPGAVVPLKRDPTQTEDAPFLVLGHGDHSPNSPTSHIDDFYSRHAQGINCLFADGSVHSMANSVNLSVWYAIQTRAGGEVFTADW